MSHSPNEELLMEAAMVAGEIKDVLDHHKSRLREGGFDPVTAMNDKMEPYLATLLLARAVSISTVAMLLRP